MIFYTLLHFTTPREPQVDKAELRSDSFVRRSPTLVRVSVEREERGVISFGIKTSAGPVVLALVTSWTELDEEQGETRRRPARAQRAGFGRFSFPSENLPPRFIHTSYQPQIQSLTLPVLSNLTKNLPPLA